MLPAVRQVVALRHERDHREDAGAKARGIRMIALAETIALFLAWGLTWALAFRWMMP